MKKFLASLLVLLACSSTAFSQKKYQSLMWEITGNGLTKPSYLYGTMHVSSKIAFHLGDSFFVALTNVDMVALEINPETWVDDMLAYDPYAFMGENALQSFGQNANENKEGQRRNAVMAALRRDPGLINYYLYRSQGYAGNFEEDTYLDLYIFQSGKKLKKQVAGLEKMGELMLMLDEAQRASEEEYKYKEDDYGYNNWDEDYRSFEDLLEDAYRRGDLDMIDSLNIADGTPGYLEYMLYRRNQNMADRMDTIMRQKGLSLFAGMGASHLPGQKGVIEMLREKGYTLRPIVRGERETKKKNKIDKIVIEKKFTTQTSFDKYFSVDLPGKMYELPGFGTTRSYFHPDMGNGAYYTVTRIKTFGRDLEQNQEYILKSIDSLLYENVPGKMRDPKKITRNGHKGISITSVTGKGNTQRYEIIVTPEEIFVFKLGGTGEFAKEKEADKFFNSIKLNIPNKTEWKDFSSPDGLFTLQMPHAPLFYGDTSLLGVYFTTEPFTAIDFNNGNTYSIARKYAYQGSNFTISDSLLTEAQIFDFGEKKYYDVLSRTQSTEGNLQVTDVRYRMDEKNNLYVRYALRQGYLYILSVKYKNDSADAERFVRSLRFSEPPAVSYSPYTDTLMHFSVSTTPQKDALEKLIRKFSRYKEKDKPYLTLRETKAFIESTKAESAVAVTYIRYGRYVRFKDSASYWGDIIDDYNQDSSAIILGSKMYHKNGFDVYEVDFTDTGCTYAIKEVNMQRNAVLYVLRMAYNQNKGISPFMQTFLETFTPADTIIGEDIFSNNAPLFIGHLASADSATRTEARESLREVRVKPEHFKQWTAIIDTLQPTNEKYFEYKSQLIEELWDIKTPQTIAYLKGLYEKAGDTNTFQLSVLKTLLYMETAESYKTFTDLLITETPLGNNYEINSLFWNIDDSLELAATLYPHLLKLFTLDEYKEKIVSILATLADSSRIKPDVYKDYLPALVNEAKNEQKRQASGEVEEEADADMPSYDYGGRYNYSSMYNNYQSYLGQLLSILLPYYDDKNVKQVFDKVLQMKDDRLRMQTAIKLLQSNRTVPDTLWEGIAKKPADRISLYDALEKAKLLSKFPVQYRNQDSMARALLATAAGSADTVVLVGRQQIEFEGEKGYVYFYKYRYPKNETWRLAMVGMQPLDTAHINISTRFLSAGSRQKINDAIPLEKQMAVLLKEELLSNALGLNSSEGYYSGDEYDEEMYYEGE